MPPVTTTRSQAETTSPLAANDVCEAETTDLPAVEKDEGAGPTNILSRTASRVSASSIGPPPDGGAVAWTQVLMGHLVVAVSWGFLNSFGVFQTYFVQTLGHPPSDISWIGSLQIFFIFFVGTFSGRALDAGLFRPTLATGMILQLIGIFTLSAATKYWQVLLAQGVCVGIGDGIMFCPTTALVSTYFSKRKVMAVALVACGSSSGGLIFPAMVRQLLPTIGFGWTVRAIGFIVLGLDVLAFTFLRTRVPPRTTGSIVDWSAFKEMTYMCFVVGMFFAFWALYFTFFYIGSYARDFVGFSYTDSTNLLLVLNGLGFIGRLAPAWIADTYTGPLNLVIPLSAISGIMIYAWHGATTTGPLYVIAVVYGIFSNGIQALFPATLGTLTTDLRKTGTRMGMGFTIVSFAGLTGAPIAGALIQEDGGRYLYAQIWGGTSFFVAAAFLLTARIARTGWRWTERV